MKQGGSLDQNPSLTRLPYLSLAASLHLSRLPRSSHPKPRNPNPSPCMRELRWPMRSNCWQGQLPMAAKWWKRGGGSDEQLNHRHGGLMAVRVMADNRQLWTKVRNREAEARRKKERTVASQKPKPYLDPHSVYINFNPTQSAPFNPLIGSYSLESRWVAFNSLN